MANTLPSQKKENNYVAISRNICHISQHHHRIGGRVQMIKTFWTRMFYFLGLSRKQTVAMALG